MGADGGMDGGGTDRREEEAAVSKLSLEGNRDRNRWQRISGRAKFSPENSCLSFQALKGCREAGQTLLDVTSVGLSALQDSPGIRQSQCLHLSFHSPFSSETKVFVPFQRSLHNRGKSSGDEGRLLMMSGCPETFRIGRKSG